MTKRTTAEIVRRAWELRVPVPGFNIPYLPMMEPVVRALRDTRCLGLVMVARLEWERFEAGSLRAIREEYERVKDERFTRLHLDHVPVIDENDALVDYRAAIAEALALGYESVMIDGSRLALDANIAATREIVALGRAAGVAVEAELGAVLGHEEGPLPPYEELFASGRGFTDPAEAARFVRETGVDWLSVAIGNVHGAVSKAKKDAAKVRARLSIPRLDEIARVANVPIVLHGGTGIEQECVREGVRHGIAKINIATAIRQPYERAVRESVAEGQRAVYDTMLAIVRDELRIENSAEALLA
jgi:ketose-bisphosphate aldolase